MPGDAAIASACVVTGAENAVIQPIEGESWREEVSTWPKNTQASSGDTTVFALRAHS
jgi:hypothetical protein